MNGDTLRAGDWMDLDGIWKRTLTYRDGRQTTLTLANADDTPMQATVHQWAAYHSPMYRDPPRWWMWLRYHCWRLRERVMPARS